VIRTRPLLNVPGFSGPLDLLLNLIQKRRLDASAVSLAAVADQYLAQVLAIEEELDALSDFLVLGSQLLAIKARALLPAPAVGPDEEDPTERLQRRLREYEAVRRAASWLAEREEEGGRTFGRSGAVIIQLADRPLASLSARRLAAIGAAALAGHVAAGGGRAEFNRPRLEDRMRLLAKAVRAGVWTHLGRLLGGEAPTAVATFLALLVLVRRGVVQVRQVEPFGPVVARRRCVGTSGIGDLDREQEP
jgi:segregation and condensation protein A